MQEENTVQEQEQTPHVSRVREYMTAKFPDREFGDDDELEQALYDYLTQSDKKIAGHEAANKTIMEVVQAYPEFAQIIEDVANGIPVQVAIARQFDSSELAVPEGEPDYEAYKQAAEERTKRLADMKARVETREKNMARSKTDVDAFFAEQGLSEEEQQRFVAWVDNEILANLLDGKVNKEILTKLYQGWVYDTAVAEARETGKVEGRNEQIETRRVRAQKTDGLPADGGGVEATSASETDDRMPPGHARIHRTDRPRLILHVGHDHAVPSRTVEQLYPCHEHLHDRTAAPLPGFEQHDAHGLSREQVAKKDTH